MARLLKATERRSPEGDLRIEITYAVGSDIRYLTLDWAEIDGLSPEQIRGLAQERADADTGLPGDTGRRENIVPTLNSMPGWATWTAAEAEAWIDSNVVDLASAKMALKSMAKAIVYLRDIAIER